MAKAALFLTDSFVEAEALVTVDILRRGKVEVTTISLTGKEMVNGKPGTQNKKSRLAAERAEFLKQAKGTEA